jgi:ABC-2 type transport system ATP-binding protein
MSYIKINKLSKKIKDKQVLKDINIELKKGYIYGFHGRNGSGKTMLFRAISGLIKPSEGEIIVGEKNISGSVFPDSMGLIIESVGFWPYYTGFKNLKILASIKNKITDNQIIESIKRVGLNPESKKTYKQYSLGMKQKLGIAQAIMEIPELIIMDEPTNSLDIESVENVRKILLEEKNRGATILLASHNREDLNILCDKTYLIDKGILSDMN